MRVTKGTARHATIHFGGHHDRASVNVEHTYAGGSGGALPAATDVDVDVPKGGALARAIDTVAKLLAQSAGKKLGVQVSVIAPKKDEKPAAAKKAPARKRAATT